MKTTLAVIAAVVAIIALLYVATVPTAQTEMTETEIAQIEAEVLELAEAWMDSWEDVETDCETAIDLFHPEHMAHFSRGIRLDRAGWLEYCNRTAANRAELSGSWTNPEVRVLSSDAAVFVSSYDYTVSYNTDAPTRHYPTAAQVILVERTATGWGITTFSNFNGPSEVVEEG